MTLYVINRSEDVLSSGVAQKRASTCNLKIHLENYLVFI